MPAGVELKVNLLIFDARVEYTLDGVTKRELNMPKVFACFKYLVIEISDYQ